MTFLNKKVYWRSDQMVAKAIFRVRVTENAGYLGFVLFQETWRIRITVKRWTLSLGDNVLSWQRNRNSWWRATPYLSDHHRLLFHRRIKSMIQMYPRRRGSVLEPPLISCSFATSSSNMPDMIIYEYKVDKHEFRKTFVAFLNSA